MWNYYVKKVSFYLIGVVLLIILLAIILPFTGREKSNKKKVDPEPIEGGLISSREASGDLIIKSRDIVSFYYGFTTNGIIYRGYNVPYDYCNLSIKKELDQARVNIFLEGYESNRLEFTVDLEKLLSLQELVEKENIASRSGEYKEVAGIPERVGSELSIEYASGENIFAYDNTGHVLPSLTTGLIYDFFRELALETDQEDFASKKHKLTSNPEYKVIARGNWLDEGENTSLEFNGDKLRIIEGENVVYDDNFSISIGFFLNQEGKMRFGPFNYIYIKDKEIIFREFGQDDLVFRPGEDYFLEMLEGSWQDCEGKYRLDFKDSRLEIYENANLLLAEDIFLEHGSIYVKDKKDESIGPFRNLYAEIGYLEVLPYVSEEEEKSIIFYPIADE